MTGVCLHRVHGVALSIGGYVRTRLHHVHVVAVSAHVRSASLDLSSYKHVQANSFSFVLPRQCLSDFGFLLRCSVPILFALVGAIFCL